MAFSPDYGFARRPVWLVGHLVALAAVVGFVFLGLWQFDRHEVRRGLDAVLTARLELPPAELTDVVGDPAAAEFRPVVVRGSYRPADEVILQARSHEGRSGHEVLTPLVLADGSAVIVDRGWVPIDVEGPPVVGAEAAALDVEVEGYVRLSQRRTGLGPVDPADGVLDRVARVDLDRLQQQIDLPLLGFWVQLRSQEPSQAEFPLPVEPPRPGEGPAHLSYAVQWFAFAAIVAIAYPILLRRTARRGGSALAR